jgi:hypothetical protein
LRGRLDRSLSSPQALAAQLKLGEVEPHIEFELVVVRLHPAAQLVEGFVVLLFD